MCGSAPEQAVQKGSEVPISGGIQETCGHDAQGHGLLVSLQ